jgi:hypothetical protein
MTLPRTILFLVIIVGGLIAFANKGFNSLTSGEIVLSVFLMAVLVLAVVSYFLKLFKGR